MHPVWQRLFINPKSKRELKFFGKYKGDRWDHGFLWSLKDLEMYPVLEGIPIFIPPYSQSWPQESLEKLVKNDMIRKQWERGKIVISRDDIILRLSKMVVNRGRIILDIATGPGGGFIPYVLSLDPHKTFLMNDISFGLLKLWKDFLEKEGINSVSFAVFDAREMPIKSNSVDVITDQAGFDNIFQGDLAVVEAYRVLKHGGILVSLNSVIDRECFSKLPLDIRRKWESKLKLLSTKCMLAEVLKRVGFKVLSNEFRSERELSPDEGELPREAAKYGVRLRIKHYATVAVKR